jgi:hypothetical protein
VLKLLTHDRTSLIALYQFTLAVGLLLIPLALVTNLVWRSVPGQPGRATCRPGIRARYGVN